MSKLFYGDIVKVKPGTVNLSCPCTVMSAITKDWDQQVKVKDNNGVTHDVWYNSDIFTKYTKEEYNQVILDKCYQVMLILVSFDTRTVSKYESGSDMRPDEDGDLYEYKWNAGVIMSDGDSGFSIEIDDGVLRVDLMNYGESWYSYRFELSDWMNAIIKGFKKYQ